MIEQIKTHWKVILICVLIAVIAFLLYKRGKALLEDDTDLNPAEGKTVEIPHEEVEKPQEAVDYDGIFSAYKAGKITQKEAQTQSGLARSTFFRKLKKYDHHKTDAV